ncbi:hypothetical protein ASG82_23815 [Mycobacterium sp. Soil538]|nr:hypothetical protein ASG82_23815 [Mycobacterium sp. Soil538]
MTFLDDALAAIPGYTEAKTAVDTVKAWRLPAIVTAGAERARIAAELTQAARAGKALPTGLIERLDADQRAAALNSKIAGLIRDTLEEAQATLKFTVSSGITSGYQHLRETLEELLAQVRRDRDQLTAVSYLDADTAIRTNQIEQWQRAETLVARYSEIRHAHFSLLSTQNSTIQRHVFAVSGQLQDPCDDDPHWINRRIHNLGYVHANVGDDEYRRHVQWLTAAQGRPAENHNRADIYPTTMPHLTWLLVIADHDVWMPDADTLTDAHHIHWVATGPDKTAAQTRTHMTNDKEHAHA